MLNPSVCFQSGPGCPAGDAEAAAEELEEMLRVGVTMRPEPTTGRSITAAPLSRKAGADDHEWAVRVSRAPPCLSCCLSASNTVTLLAAFHEPHMPEAL